MRKKLAEFNILCSVTKVVLCYLLNKRVATFTIVPNCQQIAEHSAPVIPQSIHGRIPHSTKYFRLSLIDCIVLCLAVAKRFVFRYLTNKLGFKNFKHIIRWIFDNKS